MLKVGDIAPEFCLQNQDEGWTCLKDAKGHWAIVYFYPKDNTPGCTNEAKDFSAYKQEFARMDAMIMGISQDSVLSHRRFAEQNKLTISLLSDEKRHVIDTYEVWRLKRLAGREYMGIVRSTFLIDPDGVIAHIWDKVKVDGHVQVVLDRLKMLRGME